VYLALLESTLQLRHYIKHTIHKYWVSLHEIELTGKINCTNGDVTALGTNTTCAWVIHVRVHVKLMHIIIKAAF
jgi:hypothetical protein